MIRSSPAHNPKLDCTCVKTSCIDDRLQAAMVSWAVVTGSSPQLQTSQREALLDRLEVDLQALLKPDTVLSTRRKNLDVI